MKRLFCLCLGLSLFLPSAVFAGGLEDFLGRVNIEARADLPGFSAKVSTQFGVPLPKVEAVLRGVPSPADAFMVFQLGQFAQTTPERVMGVYNTSSKKGWGAMAQELGIKPGSAEFKALKNGELYFTGAPAGKSSGRNKGKGKDGGKGHGH
jgi:hypothetical protein